jgi:hypothetical protein
MIMSSRTIVDERKHELELAFSGSVWFKGIRVESDDAGPHVVCRITDAASMIDELGSIPSDRDGIRVCFISVGKPRNVDVAGTPVPAHVALSSSFVDDLIVNKPKRSQKKKAG